MRFVLFLLSLVLWLPPLTALRLEPLPQAAARPSTGSPLDQEGLLDLALVFSGVPASAVPAYRSVFERWSTEFQAASDPNWDSARKADNLLQFLHTRLKSYSTYQTRLDVLVDRGTYNCVSSALAYMIMGRSVGLDVQAVSTLDHAFALVRLPGGREVDVETTTKFGFDPGTKTEFTDSFGHTGFAYVPPGKYAKRQVITDRELLGLLVQNRMADFQRDGRVEEAVGPAIDRWTIEGTPAAFKTLVDSFVNYASRLNGRKEFLKGLNLVEDMVAVTGQIPEARDLAWAFLNNHVNQLLDRQDFAGAQAATLTWKNRGFLTETQSSQTQAVIADRQLSSAVKNQPFAQAATLVDQAFSQGILTSARRQELLSYLYGQEVQRVASSRGAQAAWQFLGTLPAEVQALSSLAKAKEVYAYNWSVEVHNQFAKLWNAGKKADARQLLEDAMRLLPESALLKKDLVLSQGNS